MKYINAEETAYRNLQRVLQEPMEGVQDEYSDEDTTPNTTSNKFQLPKGLCGWMFMATSQNPFKEHSGILSMTQGLNIDKLKKVMTESFPDNVLKYIDGRAQTKAPLHRSGNNKKIGGTFKKRGASAKMADEYSEDDDDY